MKKITFTLLTFIVLGLLGSCSKDDNVLPNEAFDTYIKHWHKQNFANMYDMISEDSMTTYPAEDFVDRYEKIYGDIGAEDLKISYQPLTQEQTKQATSEGTITIPFTVKMNSIAGPITFDYDAKLTAHEKDEEYNWLIEWDPGFIFPQLKDAGAIGIETTSPIRGEILDRNDMPLALNDLVYEIGIVPERMGDQPEHTIKEASKLLHMSTDAIKAKLNENWVKPDLFVPLKKVPRTNDSVVNKLLGLDGIIKQEVTGRVYPSGEAAAHLIGYVGQITAEELEKVDPNIYSPGDVIGKRGLEELFEEQLKGVKGVKITVSTEDEGEIILAETPAKNGENIQLTIDANIQDKVFNAYGGEAGTAAAIHPKTGETLALVSSPSFDPNELLYGISQSRWDELNNNPKKPFLNRFAATYAPGSVIKPITAAIGLENGSIEPEKTVEIDGLKWSKGKEWGDNYVKRMTGSSKPVDLADALIRSDNIYFAMQAIDMGTAKFVSGLEGFGFGEELPFKYPITNSTISSSGKLAGELELANTSYGQAEIEMSALHLATTYTAFLNEGNMLQPTLLLNEETGQIWHEKLLEPKQATLIQEILRDVVTKGTAKNANQDELAISGKTGTAELKLSRDSKGHDNVWFVGYPTDSQNILIAMMVEHAENIGSSGFATNKVTEILLELQ